MGKGVSLGSLGPGFESEGLHLLSGAKMKSKDKGRRAGAVTSKRLSVGKIRIEIRPSGLMYV